MRRSFFALALCLGAACPTTTPSTDTALLSELRATMAQRERRLSSYHVAVETEEAGQHARHEFFYRAPNRFRGEVTEPQAVTLSFDGTTLFRRAPGSAVLERYELQLAADKAALLLSNAFNPFVPEGFRTPLLPSKGVTAARAAHPLAAQAAELTVQPSPDVKVVYIVRAATGDVLGKRITAGSATSETAVVEELCEPTLTLCVPKRVEHREGGKTVATTTLTRIDLNPALPVDDFTLTAAPGETVERKQLYEPTLPQR